jgi:hypothetical protein
MALQVRPRAQLRVRRQGDVAGVACPPKNLCFAIMVGQGGSVQVHARKRRQVVGEQREVVRVGFETVGTAELHARCCQHLPADQPGIRADVDQVVAARAVHPRAQQLAVFVMPVPECQGPRTDHVVHRQADTGLPVAQG